jgi:serine/threonine protein kinase
MECLKDNFVEGQLLDGRFRTVAPLNHGSFGMVFLAKDTKTGEDVAVKCLTKSSSTDFPGLMAVDERSEELECHARLVDHPNIVNLIHSFETSTHIYLVLEYCSMGDLYEAIRVNRGPLETEHVRDFMLQLVDAVEFMHSNGLYHRDIKPENIFLTQDGSMKLGDFGLATRSPWCQEACVGSDRYMAPEQYDPPPTGYSPAKADIWSIGICLLNILFARNPFVTPTESDVIFADYVRDRQSLFDVFPNMSQDTFEILRNALALDPEKRSLSGVRDAIVRTVSFTTDDESLDDFCTEDRDVVPASANREPLRTPSVQSPHINQGDSFPWAKALQASPQQAIRQLSAIPDTESYSEDLFPPSETAGTSWYTVHPETPSMASVLDSALGASFKSMTIRRNDQPYPPMSGSLPSHAIKPLPAMSMVFGKNKHDPISKSWSDLWDEEESENEEASLQQRREHNARSWSQESKDAELPLRPAGLFEATTSSLVNSRSQSPQDVASLPQSVPVPVKSVDSENATPISHSRVPPFRYTPPKRSNIDKWAALGDRRRNYRTEGDSSKKQRSMKMSWRRNSGPESPSPNLWLKRDDMAGNDRHRNPFLNKDWRRDHSESVKVKIVSDSPSDYHGSVDEDLDLVGGWHDLHL